MDSLTEKHFDEDAVVIEEGKANNTFYVIKSGTVSVTQESAGEIATLTVCDQHRSRDGFGREGSEHGGAGGGSGRVCVN